MVVVAQETTVIQQAVVEHQADQVAVQVYLTVAQQNSAVLGHPDRVTQAGLQQVAPIALMVVVVVALARRVRLAHQLGKAAMVLHG